MGENKKIAIRAENLSKVYSLWNNPSEGLRYGLFKQLYKWFPLELLGAPSFADFKDRNCKEFNALLPLSLEIQAGECFGVIGRNGSGKSTLLQLLCGVLQPSSGTVHCDGKIAALLELGSGFNKEFTGRENVYLNAAIHGVSRKEVDKLLPGIEDFAGIGGFFDRKVKTYSSGMVVRLAFSVLAHLEPDVLIIDEALAVGDAFFVQKCMRWLDDFKKSKTVILVSHDLSAITQFCDRVAWIDSGELQYMGSPRRATELYLESRYNISTTGGQDLGREKGHSKEHLQNAQNETSDVMPDKIGDPIFTQVRESGEFDYPWVQMSDTSPTFGERKIEIVHVQIKGKNCDDYYGLIRGGETVQLRVVAEAREAVESPIIGFGLKNKKGQELFHDNTYLSSFLKDNEPIHLDAGEKAVAEFEFVMPYLPPGDYFIFAAVATGTHRDHQQQHWIHEAIKLTSASRRICLGLIGLPMIGVSLTRIRNQSF